MSRSLFLLIVGIYAALLATAMLFAPKAALENYGILSVDINHSNLIQFLGVSTGALSGLMLHNRNAPNSFALRSLLLTLAVHSTAGAVLGMYHTYVQHTPSSTFFVVDSVFRLALGAGFLYFYTRETKLASVGGSVPA
jgi:small basic protein